METGNAIELKGVTKRFGDVIANDNVNLTVRKGEILSILGENGSGKTTLMNMLSGIYFPDEGEVYVDGKEVTIRSPKDSFALGIGMIHQHFKLINILTAAENIILGLPGKEKLNMKQVEKEIRELTEQYCTRLSRATRESRPCAVSIIPRPRSTVSPSRSAEREKPSFSHSRRSEGSG